MTRGGPIHPTGLRRWAPILVALPFLALVAQAVVGFDRLQMVLFAIAPLAVALFLNVELGVYALLGFSTVVVFIKRMMPNLDSNQVGLALEAMLLLMGIRMILDLVVRRDWSIFKSPVTVPVVAFVAYQAFEVFNPIAPSLQFGLYGMRDAMRAVGVFLVLYYFRSELKIRRFINFWVGLLLLDGMYGIWQHHHGLLNQEYLWLLSSGSYRTHILNGYIRVFGTVGDAATFGFLMITGLLLLSGLAIGARGWRRWALLALTAPLLYAMTLSYSRGPVVAVAAGLAVMLVASRNWQLALGVALVLGLALGGMAAAGQSHLLDRLLTATKPGEDASFLVRMGYINDYLPRILERPFGSGLWTAGASGLSITGGQAIPGTTIGVPTDNNYFKYGLEMGWVGLVVFAWLLVSIEVVALKTYLRLRDPYLRAIALGLVGVFTCYLVGAFSNDIFVQKPLSEWFYLAIGLTALLAQHREVACASR